MWNSAAGLFKQTVELNDNLKHKSLYTRWTDVFVSYSCLGKGIFKALCRQYVILGRASLLWYGKAPNISKEHVQ